MALDAWHKAHGLVDAGRGVPGVPRSIQEPPARTQHVLNMHAHKQLKENLIATVIAETSMPQAGTWLTALPLPHLGLTMSAQPTVKSCVIVPATTSTVYADPRPCQVCSTVSLPDMSGDHDAMCRGAGKLIRRHNAVRDTIFSLAQQAHMAPRREEAHLVGTDDDRPADVLLP